MKPGHGRSRGRHRGFTVALIGPDGAGKTTLARRLERELPLPATYLYMGVNPGSSNVALPTTRILQALKGEHGSGRSDGATHRSGGSRVRRAARSVRRGLGVANRIADEWYRQLVAQHRVRRGRVVIFDRHFLADFHGTDIAGDARSLSARVHGLLLARLYPRPDLVVVLDAEPHVLFARKGEGTVDSLGRLRNDYLALARSSPHAGVIDAARPADEVTRLAQSLIASFAAGRLGQPGEGGLRSWQQPPVAVGREQ